MGLLGVHKLRLQSVGFRSQWWPYHGERRFSKRESKGKCASFPDRAFHPHASPVRLDNLFYKSKAETGASNIARFLVINSKEFPEKLRERFFGNSNALI